MSIVFWLIVIGIIIHGLSAGADFNMGDGETADA